MADIRYAIPAPDLVAAQSHGKEVWRRQQAQLPLQEKIRLLLDLQRKLHPLLRQRRTMRPWEHPWEIDP